MNKKAQSFIRLAVVVLVLALLVVSALTGKFALKNVGLGLDLAGGVSITYEAQGNVTQEDMDDTIYKLQKRIANYDSESVCYQEGENRINIDVPGANDAEEVLRTLGKAGAIYYIVGPGNVEKVGDKWQLTEAGKAIFEQEPDAIKSDSNVILDGSHIASANATTISNNGLPKYIVEFKLNEVGTLRFAQATKQLIGYSIAIVYDGEVVSAPVVNTVIDGGEAYIEGMNSIDEAKNLASTIRIGALPIELKEIKSSVVGATLGQEAISTSLLAGSIGLAIVILFMIAYYRIPGVAASLALIIYIGLMIFLLNAFDISLTLAGVAGIILSVGMAVDANVIIFQRIREELATGKTVMSSMQIGFNKAKSSIIDGNITTLIAAAVLYFVGTGSIQGFAVTLAIGIILSMLTALGVTRFILYTLFGLGLSDEKLYGVAKERKPINFVKNGKWYAIGSGAVILAGIVGMLVFGAVTGDSLNFGLDFKGGTSFTVTFPDKYSNDLTGELEKYVADKIGKVANISRTDGENTYTIKTVELEEETRDLLISAWESDYQVDHALIQYDSISGTISGEMRSDAIKAVIIATVCMLIYIWIRFKDARFAASAVTCLVHDVLVVITLYVFARITVTSNFIACMLTLVGYSINATIVVFDRIRESVNKQKEEAAKSQGYAKKKVEFDYEAITNKAITDTLSRSINTSLTTFVMVFLIAILGVQSIREFAIPLMVGLVVGTYSSVCIAGSFWCFLKKKIADKAPEEDYDDYMKRKANLNK
ncbi:MAG: protein translocase subunit SecD [Lachnospiraceae bacterium]|nr:protein translocase subunit SecD [Lachnospiraceae bacterium]